MGKLKLIMKSGLNLSRYKMKLKAFETQTDMFSEFRVSPSICLKFTFSLYNTRHITLIHEEVVDE